MDIEVKRSSNVIWHDVSITRIKRESTNYVSHNSSLIWLTGLSGSGKSTIAHALEDKLFQKKELQLTLQKLHNLTK